MKMVKKARVGFTLVELLLVISIIGILSALGLSIMAGAEQDALESRTRAGIERISQTITERFEENVYRILPVRPAIDSTPEEVRGFREGMFNELMRIEFPYLQGHIDPAVVFPVGDPGGLGVVVANDRPQISDRYWTWISNKNPGWNTKFAPTVLPPGTARADYGADIPVVGAECLYTMLSLNYDENGDPMVSILRDREIGDTDGDGVKEVLDAFGDPLQFAVLAKVNPDDIAGLALALPPDIVQLEAADTFGYEVILDPAVALTAGQVRGPRPYSEYRVLVWSVNLNDSEQPAVSTQ